MTRDEIIQAIYEERKHQNRLHPSWYGDDHGLAILMEEVGEVAKALYEMRSSEKHSDEHRDWSKNLEVELVQVAAVCVRWLEHKGV